MVDKAKVEQAIRLLLEGIGEDVEREGLKETPNRIELHGCAKRSMAVSIRRPMSIC